jgi:hypothetical protein
MLLKTEENRRALPCAVRRQAFSPALRKKKLFSLCALGYSASKKELTLFGFNGEIREKALSLQKCFEYGNKGNQQTGQK